MILTTSNLANLTAGPVAPAVPSVSGITISRLWCADQTQGTGFRDLTGNGGHLVLGGTAASLVSGVAPSGRKVRRFTGAEYYTDATYAGNTSNFLCGFGWRSAADGLSTHQAVAFGTTPELYINDVAGYVGTFMGFGGPGDAGAMNASTNQFSVSMMHSTTGFTFGLQGKNNGGGATLPTTVQGAVAISGVTLGGGVGGAARYIGDWAYLWIGSLSPDAQFLSDAQANALDAWAYRYWHKPQNAKPTWVLASDSIGSSVGLTTAQSYTTQLATALGSGFNLVGVSQPAQTLTVMLQREADRADVILSKKHINGCFMAFEPRNDIQAGVSAATCYTNLQTYDAARLAAGFNKTAYTTCMVGTDITGGNETARVAYNTTLRAKFSVAAPDLGAYWYRPASGWGLTTAAMCDVDALQVAEGLTFRDGVHQTAVAAARTAVVTGAGLAAFLV